MLRRLDSRRPSRLALALTGWLLLLAPGMLFAELSASRWVLEAGVSQANAGPLLDPDCEATADGSAHFLNCGGSGPLDSTSNGAWALGFDTRMVTTDSDGAAWWAGLRLGRSGPVSLRGDSPAVDDPSADFSSRFRSDYAILIMRREFGAWGGLRPHFGLGAGVARNSLRDPRWDAQDTARWAEDGDTSGYMLRLSLGLNWQIRDLMVLGLELRHDALDGMATGDGPENEPPARGRADFQSAMLVLSLPFGSD